MSSQQLATPHLFPWMQNTMGLDEDELELFVGNWIEL